MNKDLLPKIKAPCPKKWDELDGDAKRRFCSECKLHVHNLSEMSARERSDFLCSPGRKCGAYLQTPHTRTVRLGLWRFLDRLRLTRPAVAALALFAAVFGGGCATTYRKDPACPAPEYKAFAPAEKGEDGKAFMTVGLIIEERPLWKRILWPWGN